MLFYNCVKPILLVILNSLYRIEVVNEEVLSNQKGVLLVGNHSSWIDTLIITKAARRRIWFATGDFILNVPIMGYLVRKMCIIPMTKSHGQAGIENAIKKLQEKETVCIFPEGVLTDDGEVHRFRNGVAKIQKESNAPIIPFYIKGAYDVWSKKQKFPLIFKKIQIIFGDEFYPSQNKDNEIATEIRNEVIKLA